MSISINFNGLNPSFNAFEKSAKQGVKINSTSNGKGLNLHISRDQADADEVAEHSHSLIHSDATYANIHYISADQASENLEKARKLVDERMDILANHKVTDSNYDATIKELQKKRDAARKRWKRAEKRKAKPELIAKYKADFEAKKLQAHDYTFGNRPTNNYDQWNDQYAVGYSATVQISKDTLASYGWQFYDKSTGKRITDPGQVNEKSYAFNYNEQLEYERNHADCNAIKRTKFGYQMAFDALKQNDTHYGAVINGALHFDETIPHLDVMGLTIGQHLDGSWIQGHIGEADNGTHGVKYNIRHRTFLNGRNGLQNNQWTSKLQDRFADDVTNAFYNSTYTVKGTVHKRSDRYNHDEAKKITDALGLYRGTKIDKRIEDAKSSAAATNNAVSAAVKMEDEASAALYHAKDTKVQASATLSEANDIKLKASKASEAASLAEAATKSSLALVRSEYDSSFAEASKALKSSYIARLSRSRASLASSASGFESSVKASVTTKMSVFESSTNSTAKLSATKSANIANAQFQSTFTSSANASMATFKDSVESSATDRMATFESNAKSSATESANTANSQFKSSFTESANASMAAFENSVHKSATNKMSSFESYAIDSIGDSASMVMSGVQDNLNSLASTKVSAAKSLFDKLKSSVTSSADHSMSAFKDSTESSAASSATSSANSTISTFKSSFTSSADASMVAFKSSYQVSADDELAQLEGWALDSANSEVSSAIASADQSAAVAASYGFESGFNSGYDVGSIAGHSVAMDNNESSANNLKRRAASLESAENSLSGNVDDYNAFASAFMDAVTPEFTPEQRQNALKTGSVTTNFQKQATSKAPLMAYLMDRFSRSTVNKPLTQAQRKNLRSQSYDSIKNNFERNSSSSHSASSATDDLEF